MSAPFSVRVCTRCGHAVHPPRLLCPVCANDGWRDEQAPDGVAEELTTRGGDGGVQLASVRTDRGPRVIARVAPGDVVRAGERVVLAVGEGGAVTARRGEE